MTRQNTNPSDLEDVAARVTNWLREGVLCLRDLAGLQEHEMKALEEAARSLRRQGNIEESLSILGLLLTYDPLKAEYWRDMADLQLRRGQHALAATCYEAVAVLSGRDVALSERQALCLEEAERTSQEAPGEENTEGRHVGI